MTNNEECVFKKHLEHASDTLCHSHESDVVGDAEFCNVTACKGVLDVANARLHGECMRPEVVKQVVGDEAAMSLLGAYTPDEPQPILPVGNPPQELFVGSKEGRIMYNPDDTPLQDDNLGHIGRGAISNPYRHRR